MKKLNRKGFTLVELLAVIIILAVVVGFTIPAVLTTTNNAKVKAGKNAAQAVADWVDRQYQVVSTGLAGTGIAEADPAFTAFCNTDGSYCDDKPETEGGSVGKSTTADATNKRAFILASGVNTSNVSEIKVTISSTTGRSCVELTIPTSSDYYFSGVTKCTTGENNCYTDSTTIKGGSC